MQALGTGMDEDPLFQDEAVMWTWLTFPCIYELWELWELYWTEFMYKYPGSRWM